MHEGRILHVRRRGQDDARAPRYSPPRLLHSHLRFPFSHSETFTEFQFTSQNRRVKAKPMAERINDMVGGYEKLIDNSHNGVSVQRTAFFGIEWGRGSSRRKSMWIMALLMRNR